MNTTDKRRSIRRTVLGAAVMLTATAALPVVLAPSAAADVSGLVTARASSDPNTNRKKTVTAYCPSGKRVLGGGGAAIDDVAGSQPRATRLVRMEPIRSATKGDGYTVSAEEPDETAPFVWHLNVWAICASPPPGLEIVTKASGPSRNSSTFKTAAAVCPNGKRVVGSGAEIVYASHAQIGLTLTRSDLDRSTARAAAREDGNGYAGSWLLLSHAVCANPISDTYLSAEVVYGSEVTTACPGAGSRPILSAGAGTAAVSDVGPYFLQQTFVSGFDFDPDLWVRMTGPPPGGMAVYTVCLDA
jgi:hypothetical protein